MKKIVNKIMALKKKIVLSAVVILIFGFGTYKILASSQKQPVQYQTATAEKGTLINSISSSGSITSGNNTSVTTKVSGVVKAVYVTNGDSVTKGQKIADIVLDDYARERQTAAWVTYLEATEAAKEALNSKALADIQMWQDRESVLNAQEDVNNNVGDTAGEKMIVSKTLDQTRLAFSVSESKYLNANADIAYANAKVAAGWRNYQENSATIIAPANGVISDLMLAPELILTANSSTSNTSGATIVSAQTIGKISNPQGQLTANVSLSEIDIINIKANQKATLTLDAYPDKTFTGKVLAVNTSGSVSSGVTSYPATILLDPTTIDIYPNMAVNAQIITNFVTDVILIPSAAISTNNTVQIMKDDKVETVAVETGEANDSQTVIVSGINEGDKVVTGTQNNTASPFGGSNIRIPGGGFGGEVRFQGR